MSSSRAAPSGEVYRQLFDAQAQLSRSLLAGHRLQRTDCLSPVDSRTADSSRVCSSTSRGQQECDDEEDARADVIGLPDSLGTTHPSSGIIERLSKRRSQMHHEALKQLEAELLHLSQVCELEVRTVSEQLLSSLWELDLRLDTLKDRMGHLDDVPLQAWDLLWEEMEEELRLKKRAVSELEQQLGGCERRRSLEIKATLGKQRRLLEQISHLPPPDVHRLIHTEAMMLNQSLLANRRCVARLVLRLREENLQQEALLRLHWEARLDGWRSSKVEEVVERLRSVCSSSSSIRGDQEVQQSLDVLVKQRLDIIDQICSLVPPTCSSVLLSDWFSRLTAVNQQIDRLHGDVLHGRRRFYEHTWETHLAEVERCEEALAALRLSPQQVKEVVAAQLLPLIGRRQREDEERLAALDVGGDSVGRHALQLSRSVFQVMRASASLWETYRRRLEKTEDEVRGQLDVLKQSQQQHIQKRMLPVDVLLGALRQESRRDTMDMLLQQMEEKLQDIEDSCRRAVSDQWEVLDGVPALLMEELLSYSRSVSSFFRLSPAYRPSPAELQNFPLGSTRTSGPDPEHEPISVQEAPGYDQSSLGEGASSLLQLYDLRSSVTFTSSGGMAYTGPAFRCPAPNLPESTQHETELVPFPVEPLEGALTRTRILVLDHVERSFRDLLGSAVAMVTERKEAVRLEQEVRLTLEHVRKHVYEPRLAELQLHQQRVDLHCQDLSAILASCRLQLQDVQSSVQRRNQELSAVLTSCWADLQELQTSMQEKNRDGQQVAPTSNRRLEQLRAALQEHLERHAGDAQRSLTDFRETLRRRLEEARSATVDLLRSFRMFSEGGDFAPQEVKMFQRRLKEETKQIAETEESLCSELEALESRSLQQVRRTSAPLEEKLSSLQAEVKFSEEVQRILSRTQIEIKAEAASSNLQQSELSSSLEELRRRMRSTEVSPDQICSSFSSTNEDMKRRCSYLDVAMDSAVQDSLVLSAPADPRSKVRGGGRKGAELRVEAAIRFTLLQDPASGSQQRGTTAADQSSAHRQRRSADSISTPSVRRSSRSIRTDTRTQITTNTKFQIFGARPAEEQSPRSFSSSLTSILWRTNDVLLQLAQEFYSSKRRGSFHLLPEAASQWAEGMQQRLLGYQEKGRSFLSASRDELMRQMSAFRELLASLPGALISQQESQQGATLTEEVGVVRKKLEEELATAEEEKSSTLRQLKVSLSEADLEALDGREEQRQQRLHSATISTHLELRECMRRRAEEFVTSLSCLAEKLLHLLDELLTDSGNRAPLDELLEAARNSS